ncbi:MAG: hypothetical protein PHQ75_02710 [Thermoguttaceae bacterium]|nr:hypothetical protein [Thermoguttaceae bacterium]
MAKIIKRVNSTGRQRITKDHVFIEIINGEPRTFLVKLQLDNYHFPANASVVLDLFSAGSVLSTRFHCGTVGQLNSLGGSLEGIDAEKVYFTLKVIDQTERFGRILGLAEGIRPRNAGRKKTLGNQGLLAVATVELNGLLWKLDFRAHDEGVILLVNKNISDFAARFNTPEYAALLYPAILRTILERALCENTEDESEGWPQQWLRFGQSLHPDREEPPESESDGSVEAADAEAWIDPVIEAFCKRFELLKHFTSASCPEIID